MQDFKQGTSQNESWHKYLKRGFIQYSGSVSIELVELALLHLQWLFNEAKDNHRSTVDLQITSNVVKTTASTQHKTAEALVALGYRLKKKSFEFPRKQDVDQCRIYVQQILLEKDEIPHSLIHELAHYKFDNQFSKAYVRLLLQELQRRS